MSDRYDVAARLAEGRPAVEHIGSYVQACEALGYAQPDLTGDPSQVRDWYDTEAGLDLRLLDGDTQALRAAVTAIEEALWVQRTQVAELAAAWRGSGAEAATRFLQRHCDVASDVTAHVRAAVEQYGTLLDALWRSIDGKVATTVAIDERRAAQRSVWLGAAQVVTAGAGDRSAAELIVHRDVWPFVDNDIRNEWLAAMSAANASVAASYDAAIHALASTPDVCFEVPGDLGPRWQPAFDDRPVVNAGPMPADPLPTVPAAAPAAPQPALRSPRERTPEEADESGPAATELAEPLGDAAGLSNSAGGLGGLGSATGGLSGIVGSIVDSIGSLLGSLAGGLGGDGIDQEPATLDDPDDDEPDDAAHTAGGAEDVMPEAPVDSAAAEPPGSAVGEPAAQQAEPAPPPDAPQSDAPPPVELSTPTDEPPAAGSTPCEIAEDELPQAGQ